MITKRPARPGCPSASTEKVFVSLNGVRQGMFITGADHPAPVLLYLHGGMPEFFLERAHPSGLERLFTVVWWEQPGSGLSSRAGMRRDRITVDRLIDDTLALSDHLRQRFDQPRIYLMGHSGGTFIGIQAVAWAPDLFHAYVGVAQISDQLESEALAYRYMLEECLTRGHGRLARRLRKCPVTKDVGTPAAYLRVRDTAMHRLGVGTMRSMRSVMSGIVLPSLRCRDYSVSERVRLWVAKAGSGASVVWDAMLATDLRRLVQEVRVPTYFLHGVHDHTCSYSLAREYFQSLTAPTKGFYSFESSAHSPIFEEPERAQRILRTDVLRGTTSLADDAAPAMTT
jgi:pimeloyl-ACP methyl ester carboxylesterase